MSDTAVDKTPLSLIRKPVVRRKLGNLSETTLWRLQNDETANFPKPIPISKKSIGWIESEIDQWIADLAAKR